MPTPAKPPRIPMFFAIGIGLSLLAAALKVIATWLAETYLYAVPWIGGFLRSIELAEISNLVAFAIVGAGIGAATVLLPRRWNHRAKLAVLAAVSPFVFSAGYMVQQHLWIQRVAQRADIPYREARIIANGFLKKEAGSGGFFGFFPLSTQLAELPTRRRDLESARPINPSEALTKELASYNDPRADFVAFVFERVGWVVRFMYMTIAALTGLIYYFKGHSWAEARRLSRLPAMVNSPRGGSGPSGKGVKGSRGPSGRSPSSKGPSGKGPSSKGPSGKGPSGKGPRGGSSPSSHGSNTSSHGSNN
ncbi:MAG: hypothetical protein AAFP03_06775 [Cyanobacteria bacterium J06598_3]